jgi:hypothetical protein
MSSRSGVEQGLGWLYDLVNGEEDARVCKDIPDTACVEQPRNFFAYLAANTLSKISDELVSARLTLPRLLSLLGAPVALVGFLVPQLRVAVFVREMPKRKIV